MANLVLDLKEIEVEYIAPHVMNGTGRITLLLTIVRGARGKRKLLGEAFARTIYQPIIHFKVFDDVGLESLFSRFLPRARSRRSSLELETLRYRFARRYRSQTR